MTRCNRPDCLGRPGVVMRTGFCDTCLRKPLPGGSVPPREPDPPQTTPDPRLDRDGLVVLPEIGPPDRANVVRHEPRPPSRGRVCGRDGCTEFVGVGYGGRPALDQGFCPECGTPYSFRPQLHRDDIVGDHYRVLGCLALGGIGWVYLAEDTHVPDHLVVLKGLINANSAVARRSAVEERRSLVSLHHRDIVRIVTHVEHQAAGERQPTGYIVMDYIGGRSLQDILNSPDPAEIFGGALELGHVLTYGCKILGALEYLHDRGLLYCDMKPDNVIHYGREIKIIDLGAVRRTDDHTSALVYTDWYAPPREELDRRGFHVDGDLYTVGRTLEALAEHAADSAGLSADSFRRLIARATHDDPEARFRTAQQMSRQLWEVLREHRALSHGEQYPERSTLFEPAAELFGGNLGAIPELSRWTNGTHERCAELDVEPPPSADIAPGLPVPLPDLGDPAAIRLAGLATDSPERVADEWQVYRELHTVEVALWLCRAYLHRRDMREARRWLEEAAKRTGRGGRHDWRMAWHRGIYGLTDGSGSPTRHFTEVYAKLPGESAPKLALGYCAERWGDAGHSAHTYYEAVWQRDTAQGSAAFGLARSHLRDKDRKAAVAVLDQVPPTSRHFDAARIAGVRVLVGALGGEAPRLDHLRAASERVAELDGLRAKGGSRERLFAELRETVLRQSGNAAVLDLPGGELFGPSGDARDLRSLLHQSLRALAAQARSAGERGDLLDQAYAVRPETRF